MKNVLIVTPTLRRAEERYLAALGETGVRVKVCHDSGTALKWLETRAFHSLLIDGSFSLPHMLALANALWNRTPEAPCWVVDYEGKFSLESQTLKVYGLELALGEDGLREVVDTHCAIVASKDFDRENFPILVVEDLDSPRDIICIFLESLGFPKVVGTASAKEALHLLESESSRFACIVTDIQMPEITGKDLIGIVRANSNLQHVPIIVLTAYGTVEMLVECLHAGASGFLVKPPKKDDMLRELSRAVRISAGIESPRLASPHEAEYVRKLFERS